MQLCREGASSLAFLAEIRRGLVYPSTLGLRVIQKREEEGLLNQRGPPRSHSWPRSGEALYLCLIDWYFFGSVSAALASFFRTDSIWGDAAVSRGPPCSHSWPRSGEALFFSLLYYSPARGGCSCVERTCCPYAYVLITVLITVSRGCLLARFPGLDQARPSSSVSVQGYLAHKKPHPSRTLQ